MASFYNCIKVKILLYSNHFTLRINRFRCIFTESPAQSLISLSVQAPWEAVSSALFQWSDSTLQMCYYLLRFVNGKSPAKPCGG